MSTFLATLEQFAGSASALKCLERMAGLTSATAHLQQQLDALEPSRTLAESIAWEERTRALQRLGSHAGLSALKSFEDIPGLVALQHFEGSSGLAALKYFEDKSVIGALELYEASAGLSATKHFEQEVGRRAFKNLDSTWSESLAAMPATLSAIFDAQQYSAVNRVRADMEKMSGLISQRHSDLAAALAPNAGLLAALTVLDEVHGRGRFNDVERYFAAHSSIDGAKHLASWASNSLHENSAVDHGTGTAEVRQLAATIAEQANAGRDAIALLEQILAAIQASGETTAQKVVWFILVPFIHILVNSVIQPVADFYIKNALDENRPGAVSDVRRVAVTTFGDLSMLAQHRFVTAQGLRVRSHANARSDVIGQLRFGQTVAVMGTKGAFTHVSWTSIDGTATIQGWVFSRYLKKFVQ